MVAYRVYSRYTPAVQILLAFFKLLQLYYITIGKPIEIIAKMLLVAVLILLFVLVIWFGSTSYAPKVIIAYTAITFGPTNPRLETELRLTGLSKWQFANAEVKREYVNVLTSDLAAMDRQIQEHRQQSALSLPAIAMPTPVEPTPTLISAPKPVPASVETSEPTPVVEKFRTNLAHMHGGMHA